MVGKEMYYMNEFIMRKIGSGKSWIAASKAIEAMKKNIPTLYISTEYDDSEFLLIALSIISGIEKSRLLTADINDNEKSVLNEHIRWINSKAFKFIYYHDISIEQMERYCEMFKADMNLQYIIVDHFSNYSQALAKDINIRITNKYGIKLCCLFNDHSPYCMKVGD